VIVCQGTKSNGRPCGNILGTLEDGRFEIRHRGRLVVATGVKMISCEDCGAEWKPETSEDRISPALTAFA
jgi:hypothetical protein